MGQILRTVSMVIAFLPVVFPCFCNRVTIGSRVLIEPGNRDGEPSKQSQPWTNQLYRAIRQTASIVFYFYFDILRPS